MKKITQREGFHLARKIHPSCYFHLPKWVAQPFTLWNITHYKCGADTVCDYSSVCLLPKSLNDPSLANASKGRETCTLFCKYLLVSAITPSLGTEQAGTDWSWAIHDLLPNICINLHLQPTGCAQVLRKPRRWQWHYLPQSPLQVQKQGFGNASLARACVPAPWN